MKADHFHLQPREEDEIPVAKRQMIYLEYNDISPSSGDEDN